MAATMMDGKALAAKVRASVAEDVRGLGHVGLATLLVGDDPASDVYIRLKQRPRRKQGSTRPTTVCPPTRRRTSSVP